MNGSATMTVAAGVAGTALLCPAAAAHADSPLGLSTDGVHWSSSLSRPLFDPALRRVPGDAATVGFYVRNRAGGAAVLSVRVATWGDRGLLRNGDIALSARAGSGRWLRLDHPEDADRSHRIGLRTLPGGSRTRVQVRARLAPTSTNRSQDRHLGLRLLVRLTDARATRGAEAGGGGLLSSTGAPWTLPALLAAAGLVAGGTALVRRSRRED